MNNKRIFISVTWILIGFSLICCNIAGILDDYWSGMGGGLFIIGIIQFTRYSKYRRNENYREKVDVEISDERNKYISNKAWAWSGYLFVIISSIISILMRIIGYDELSLFLGGVVCSIIGLYWICNIYLRKKY